MSVEESDARVARLKNGRRSRAKVERSFLLGFGSDHSGIDAKELRERVSGQRSPAARRRGTR